MVNEILAKQKLSKEKLQRLPKERRVTEKSAKQQVLMREKLHAQKGRETSWQSTTGDSWNVSRKTAGRSREEAQATGASTRPRTRLCLNC